jgi:transcriptional regulator with XRE-family HTH domain
MSIHSRIKSRRLAMGFTSHKALADALGVSWQTVQLWEKEGGTAPKRDRLEAVAKVLGVPSTWLLQGGVLVKTDNTLVHPDATFTFANAKQPPVHVEYIFATQEEIHLLTLFRTADDRERSELMDRLNALKKVVALPTLVTGNQT